MASTTVITVTYIVLQIAGCLSQSHYGTEFHFGIPPSVANECPNTSISIDIASVKQGYYNLTIPILSKEDENISLNSGLTTIKLPCNITKRGTFDDIGVIVLKTSVYVAVYVTIYTEFIADSLLVLPINKTGTQYFPAAYVPYTTSEDSFVLIAAFKDSTNVTIYRDNNRTVEHIFTMQEMQVSQYCTSSDLKGFSVSSDQPVSVISGTTCAKIPVDVDACDMIVEQLIPVRSWDDTYIIPPTPPKKGYELRVVAAKQSNRTTCIYNITKSICDNDSTISLLMADAPSVVVSSQPVSVFQYGVGAGFTNTGTGDPFMTTIPGLKQFMNDYYFAISPVYVTCQNFISIIIDTKNVHGLLLDNVTVQPSNGFTYNVSKPLQNYIVLIIPNISIGFHRLSHSNATVKFGLLVYGMKWAMSYGYPAGMHLSAYDTTDGSSQTAIASSTTSMDVQSTDETSSVGIIVGSVAGSVIAVCMSLCTVWFFIWRKKRNSEVEPESKANEEALPEENTD